MAENFKEQGTRLTNAIELNGHIELHGNLHVSFCDELPLIGTGMTSEDAVGNFLACLKEYIRLSLEWGVAEETIGNLQQNITKAPGWFAIGLPILGEAQFPQ